MHLLSLDNHQLLVLWVELAVLLVTATSLGALARRLGQPAVIGELLAGLLLGPSVFGHVWRAGFRWFLPAGGDSQGLAVVASISLLVLLVVIGAESDLALIRRLGRAAAWVSTGSLVLPLAAGFGLALLLPAALLGPRDHRTVFALLVAGAIGVSSLPVIARTMSDLGIIRRDVGQLAVAAGTVNDAAGFLLVAVATSVAGAAGGSSGQVVVALVGLVIVTVLVLSVGQKSFDALLRRARRHGPNVAGSLGVCLGGALVAAVAMQAIGVEGALGAFVAGMALGRSRFQQGRSLTVLEAMVTTLFSPLYFATAGLRVDVGALGRPAVLAAFGAVVAVAVVFKFVGAAGGAAAARMHWRDATALGIGLNGRGALQVIIGTAGLSIGVLNTASYTVLVVMSIVTSMATPPVLRRLVQGWVGTPQEQERLDQEAALERNVVVRGQRLLLPSGGSPNSFLAAEVLAAAWPGTSAVTVLSIGRDRGGRRPDVGPALSTLAPRRLEHRHVAADRVIEEIVAEAQLGYGAMAVGAAEEPSSDHLLSSVLDELLIRSPIPLLVVRRAKGAGRDHGGAADRILVPVTGTAASRAGQEVACHLHQAWGSAVVLTHVVTRGDVEPPVGAATASGSEHQPSTPISGRRRLPAAEGAADVVLRGACAMATEMGVDAEAAVRHAPSPGDEILRAVEETGADAVALGTTVRQVEGRPFLGHTVEHVLTHCRATVMVVALPESSARIGAMVAEVGGHT
jgi:Kef-type K+ transport system membrane component KefB